MIENKKLYHKINKESCVIVILDKIYHVLFNNIHFMLNQKQFISLKNHIRNIDIKYWESQFEYTSIKRKITVLTCQENLVLEFDKHEFDAFRSLFFNYSNIPKVLTVDDIEYNFILN